MSYCAYVANLSDQIPRSLFQWIIDIENIPGLVPLVLVSLMLSGLYYWRGLLFDGTSAYQWLAAITSGSTHVVSAKTQYDNMFALIIGVNAYAKLRPLSGAVADANALEQLLTDELGVPSTQILNLRNDSASRSAIIEAFQSLQTDNRIRKDDPILIFFAGHGGLGEASDTWKKEYGYEMVQAIFPCDYDVEYAASGDAVSCIPDQTIKAMLNQLAALKGNNITVIFDCCYSASGTRANEIIAANRVARNAGIKFSVPHDLDDSILARTGFSSVDLYPADTATPRGITLPLFSDQASHVHIAACGSQETAWEDEGRGVFTKALLSCISQNGAEKLTYRNLLDSLPKLKNQTPHCYGFHKSRVLFSSQTPRKKSLFVPVKQEDHGWILEAGTASGVIEGSVWELFDKATDDSEVLGRFFADRILVSSTVLKPETEQDSCSRSVAVDRKGTNYAYARRTSLIGNYEILVYFSPEILQLVLPGCGFGIQAVTNSDGEEAHFVAHPDLGSAELQVEIEPREGFLLMSMTIQQTRDYGVAALKPRARVCKEEIEKVLLAAAKWMCHLRRTEVPLANIVSMEFFKRGTKRGNYMMPLLESLGSLNDGGVVDIQVKEEDQYAIKLSNNGPAALYIRVFYFDATNFSILDMFGHSRANGRSDPDIAPHGQLTLGDGSDGGPLLSFALPDGVETELGFLKVFWSTDPLELDDITQESAFDFNSHLKPSARKVTTGNRKLPKYWGSLVATLVQRA
ncbi:ICE-like protease (caspase) p20 domain protein [Ceratobasidium sp. AG-Ba]|nr:ICE-like protease (caspase) p20 domain protein [Ceratobasidium sp. AG-Ba]